MPAKANKLYSNFNKGLITEANQLTFPENSTSDELNMTLFQAGNRTRRYGLNYSSTIALGVSQSAMNAFAVSEYIWTAANNNSNYNFWINQIGTNIYIYNLSGVLQTTFSISSFIISGPTTPTVAATRLSFISGNGFLFVAGKWTEPFVVSYDGSTFTLNRLYVLIRDFVGVDDGLGPDEEPTTLTDTHKYNLQNQGWLVGYSDGSGPTVTYWTNQGVQSTYATSSASVIDSYHTDITRYPSNNKLWWWSQKDGYQIDPVNLNRLPAGNIRAPRGHYMMNAFNKDRSAVSAVGTLPIEVTPERPSTVSYFAGRVWYGCQSTVYFSRVLEANTYYNANFCCQEADPTSQKIADLIATDGGTILIPDIGAIIKLYPVGSGMLVFGTQGVWFVQGGNGAFSATDFSVSKMSPIGMDSPGSVIEVDSQIFWMSYLGIQGMTQKNGIFGPIQGNFDKLNITQDTIQSLYTSAFPSDIRQDVKAVYDASTNTIQWLYRSSNTLQDNQYDSGLNLDLNLQAFFPWKYSSSTGTPYIIGAFESDQATLVTVGAKTRPTQVTYITEVPNGSNYDLALSQITDTTFADWRTFNGGYAYNSFLESGFEILQDAERVKWLPYIFTYFRQTETGISSPDGGVTYVAQNPSSCMMTVKWGWTNSAVSNRWTTPIQVYVLSRIPFVDSGSPTFNNGESVVQRKSKIRGSGKAVQFRFESSEIGKDFDLLGWATEYTGNSIP